MHSVTVVLSDAELAVLQQYAQWFSFNQPCDDLSAQEIMDLCFAEIIDTVKLLLEAQ